MPNALPNDAAEETTSNIAFHYVPRIPASACSLFALSLASTGTVVCLSNFSSVLMHDEIKWRPMVFLYFFIGALLSSHLKPFRQSVDFAITFSLVLAACLLPVPWVLYGCFPNHPFLLKALTVFFPLIEGMSVVIAGHFLTTHFHWNENERISIHLPVFLGIAGGLLASQKLTLSFSLFSVSYFFQTLLFLNFLVISLLKKKETAARASLFLLFARGLGAGLFLTSILAFSFSKKMENSFRQHHFGIRVGK